MKPVALRKKPRHGLTGCPEHRTWKNIVQRCTNPNNPAFADYGGRGITLCLRWRESFAHFLKDMGSRPARGYSVDRIDNEGGYEPGNCRWATRATQRRNTRANLFVEYKGETLTLADWADRLSLVRVTVFARYHRGDRGEHLFRAAAEAPRWRSKTK